MSNWLATVVDAVPPAPPKLTLLGAIDAVAPSGAPAQHADGTGPSRDQLSELPEEQRAELARQRAEDWTRGITWQPESHRAALVRDPCDQTTSEARQASLPPQTFVPFVVWAEDSCSTFGFSEHDFKGRATRLLEASKFQAVEAEFWEGTQAQASGWPNAFLTNEETVEDLTPGGGPASLERGLSILQQALQSCGLGGRGMIHMQAQTLTNYLTVHDNDPHFSAGEDDVLYDLLGNVIVPGVGYPGTGPNGAAPAAGSAWIYATDLIQRAWEDDPVIFPRTFAEATDWGRSATEEPNTIRFAAQKLVAIQWDVACHFAVRVKLAT